MAYVANLNMTDVLGIIWAHKYKPNMASPSFRLHHRHRHRHHHRDRHRHHQRNRRIGTTNHILIPREVRTEEVTLVINDGTIGQVFSNTCWALWAWVFGSRNIVLEKMRGRKPVVGKSKAKKCQSEVANQPSMGQDAAVVPESKSKLEFAL